MHAIAPTTITYFAPGISTKPCTMHVHEHSTAMDVIEHFLSEHAESPRLAVRRDVKLGVKVAYLRGKGLDLHPVQTLSERLAKVVSTLRYLDEETILWLPGFVSNTDCVQLLIQSYPGQPEFISPGVERDHAALVERAREDWSPSAVTKSPAAYIEFQAKYPILYNGRPRHFTGPPISMYEPAFMDIKESLRNLSERKLTMYTLHKVYELLDRLGEAYETASEFEAAVYPILGDLLGIDRSSKSTHLPYTTSDTLFQINGGTYLLIGNTFEEGVADWRGPLVLLKHITSSEYDQIRNTTCCPCIHVVMVPGCILFGGSILTDLFIHQPFTAHLYTFLDGPGNDEFVHAIAKSFDIFREALAKLRTKYANLAMTLDRSPSRLFPQPSYLGSPIPGDLVFENRLIDDKFNSPLSYRVVFQAKYDGNPVLVKFCWKYQADAHRMLADLGLAPKLYFFGELKGGGYMVVMDDVDGSLGADSQFKNEELPETVVDQLKEAMKMLHQQKLVYGDLRRSNILVRMEPEDDGDAGLMDNYINRDAAGLESSNETPMTITAEDGVEARTNRPNPQGQLGRWHTYLRDFDQVGKDGEDRYDLIGERSLWPPGIEFAGLMRMSHDEAMLQRIVRPESHM